jgi:hypothetical protein
VGEGQAFIFFALWFAEAEDVLPDLNKLPTDG